MDSSQILPDRLRQAREKREWSQAELASRAGFQVSAISHFEKGRRTPSADNLQRLSDALGVSIDFLLGRVDETTAVGPSIARLLQEYAKLSDYDQQNVLRFTSMLAEKNKV